MNLATVIQQLNVRGEQDLAASLQEVTSKFHPKRPPPKPTSPSPKPEPKQPPVAKPPVKQAIQPQPPDQKKVQLLIKLLKDKHITKVDLTLFSHIVVESRILSPSVASAYWPYIKQELLKAKIQVV